MTRPQSAARTRKHIAISLNIVYILVVWVVIFSGRLLEGAVLLGANMAVGIFYGLFFLLPGYLKAKRTYEIPTPPLDLALGAVEADLSEALQRMTVVGTEVRRGIFGKKHLSTLYDISIETEDGLWKYSLETRDDTLVAWYSSFESSKSKLLNFGERRGVGFFLRNDVSG